MRRSNYYKFIRILPVYIRPLLVEFLRSGQIQQVPEKIQQTKPLFNTPSALALSFNTSKHHKFVLNAKCTIVQFYIENVIASLPEQPRWFLKRNVVLYLILILMSPTKEDLEKYIREVWPSNEEIIKCSNGVDPVQFFTVICEFLKLLREAFCKEMRTNETKALFTHHILRFYALIYQYEKKVFEEEFAQSSLTCGHLPSYLIKSIKMRIYLLSYLPTSVGIFNRMQEIHYPKLYLLESGRKDKKIYFDEWMELIKYLPVLTEADIEDLENMPIQFCDAVYRIDQNENFVKKVLNVNHNRIGYIKIEPPKLNELFKQAIAFQMVNWEEIWCKMKWRKDFEMQRRLRYAKENNLCPINIVQWCRIFFQHY